jgi:nucleotide-binding universal stress UspA family protein
MKHLRNISLVYECDEPTLRRAATLAKDNRAKLTIVYPVKGLPVGTQTLAVGNKPIDIGKLVWQEYQTRLEESAKTARSLGVRPATKVLIGDPALETIRDVIGNTAERVLDAVDCSVLVVKPEGFVSPVTPLIAVEGDK